MCPLFLQINCFNYMRARLCGQRHQFDKLSQRNIQCLCDEFFAGITSSSVTHAYTGTGYLINQLLPKEYRMPLPQGFKEAAGGSCMVLVLC
jgi:hypothetical protein